MSKLISRKVLARHGIMGINQRNRDFIGAYNDRRYYSLVDDKLQTKLLAREYGIATPRLRRVIRYQHEIRRIGKALADWQRFAVKPANGSGGKGILVITGRNGDKFVKGSGAELSLDDVKRHMSNVLAGLYSLAGTPDTIIIEDVITCDRRLAAFSYQGVPDLRIIVFLGYPVMAMARLATHASDGKANLHQGAVGVGLSIINGHCLNAVQFSRQIHRHPDNGIVLNTLKVPDWDHLLVLAAGCYEMTNLGYLGCDMVVDDELGAQLLELNARPGLAIQIANGHGLLPRLRHVQSLKKRHDSPEQRVAYMQQWLEQSGIERQSFNKKV